MFKLFFLVAIIVVYQNAAAMTCPRGSYTFTNAYTCYDCWAGTYNDDTQQQSCQSCPQAVSGGSTYSTYAKAVTCTDLET